jgi:hypothetical protein
MWGSWDEFQMNIQNVKGHVQYYFPKKQRHEIAQFANVVKLATKKDK